MAKKTQTTKTATTKGTKGKKGAKSKAADVAATTEAAVPEPTGKRKRATKAPASAPEPADAAMAESAPVEAASAQPEPEAPQRETVMADASSGEATSTPVEPADAASAEAGEPEREETPLTPGTVLQKRDRHGMLRCECVVAEGGYRFEGTVYKSLSAAALAAAKSLGLTSKSINGNLFWGISKPARAAANPLASLERAWNSYQTRLEAALEKAKVSEDREPALSTLERHSRILQNLLAEAPVA